MKALLIEKNYEKRDDITLAIIEKEKPVLQNGKNCLIKVEAVGINPSDALATLGYFPHSVLPRIPGRDFAGVIAEGPKHLIGKRVWNTGGAAGISFDGALSEYIALNENEFSIIPNNLETLAAGGQALAYVTAYYSLVTRARIKAGETVFVVGALGQVGQAAMSICEWLDCQPIALVRGDEGIKKAREKGWKAYDTQQSLPNIKANVILNSIGNLIWNEYMRCLTEQGRIVTIGARPQTREVNINLFDLYRANQDIIGVNSVSLNYEENAILLNELKPGFESGKLKSICEKNKALFTFDNASEAFKTALDNKEGEKVIIEI